MPITSNHFMVSKVKHECTVEEFCKKQDLEPPRANLQILLEFNSVDKTCINGPNVEGVTRDVILMDKVSQQIIRLWFVSLVSAYFAGKRNFIYGSNCTF